VQLAKCWNLRVSGATSNCCHTASVWCDNVRGDNASGADNQQERPVVAQWVVGFVDGEGCFSVPIFRNGTCRLGWQVQPEFTVSQGVRSVHVLHELERFFGCGSVGRNGRHDNHREDMYRFRVSSCADLRRSVIPFFEVHPLRTDKANDFISFVTVVRMMESRRHLMPDGLHQIARLAEQMNRRKPSQLLESSEAIRQPPHLDG